MKSAASSKQFLKRPIPHFVFSGRSNVGKSSILNKLLNRKNLAKTSRDPGKTRLINYFLINDRLFFVDIPGYGFAKVSMSERKSWQKLIESYFTQKPYVAMVFQLLDIRRKPNEMDLQMIEWMQFNDLPFSLVLTKADKLSAKQIQIKQEEIASYLNVDIDQLFVTSAVSALGVQDLLKLIDSTSKDFNAKISGAKGDA